MSARRPVPPLDHLPNIDRIKDDEFSAELYSRRKPKKHESEMRMVENAFGLLPDGSVKSVLDAPCGVGRISVWLAQQGYEVTGVDLGSAAINLARESISQHDLDAHIEKQNVMSMNFPDKQFDCCICFRLLHHFDQPEQKKLLIGELCRVTRKFIVISYFSSVSVTTLKRQLRRLLTGKPLKQYPDRLKRLIEYFDSNGYELLTRVKRSEIAHSLQLAVFRRK